MPKMPHSGAKSIVAPLAAAKLKPVHVDRWGDHVRIRTLKPSEVTPQIAEWLTDPAVMEGLNAPKETMGLDAFRTYVASFDNLKRNLMAIRRRDNDEPLGLLLLEVDLRHRLASLHAIIGSAENRGQHLASEAASLLVMHTFWERKMDKVTFQPLARNQAAITVCEHYSLRLEGTLRAHRIDGRTGERIDQLLYALTREEFDQRMREWAAAGASRTYGGPDLPAKTPSQNR